MNTFFTADTHFQHENVLEMCGRKFNTIIEHDDHMIDQINTFVTAKDRLFVLGDFAWRDSKSVLDRLICKNIHLIIGNHDRPKDVKAFKSASETLIVKVYNGTQKVFLSHYPHAYWPGSHKGFMHLYGHVHDYREQTLNIKFPGRRSMDCGVDTCKRILGYYGPFSERDILDQISWCSGHDPVEFYKSTQRK